MNSEFLAQGFGDRVFDLASYSLFFEKFIHLGPFRRGEGGELVPGGVFERDDDEPFVVLLEEGDDFALLVHVEDAVEDEDLVRRGEIRFVF